VDSYESGYAPVVLKRMVILGVVGAFLAAPPAVAKSSSTVVKQAPAAKAQFGHGGKQCPGPRTATALDF
jgi:hypothetical protein